MATKTHNEALANKCVEKAKKVLGPGWQHVSQDLQWGLVCAEIIAVLTTQDESIPAENVRIMMEQVTEQARALVFR